MLPAAPSIATAARFPDTGVDESLQEAETRGRQSFMSVRNYNSTDVTRLGGTKWAPFEV